MVEPDQRERWVEYRILDHTDLPYQPDDAVEAYDDKGVLCEPEHPVLYDLDATDAIKILERHDEAPVPDDDAWVPYSGSVDDVVFSGPVEPVEQRDGHVEFVVPAGDDYSVIQPHKWECLRCEATFHTGYDGETVAEPHECPTCEREGPFQQVIDRHLSPQIAADDLLSTPWHTPSDCSSMGYEDLWDDVRDWIWTHWDHPDDWLFDALTAFVISSWLRPNMDFLTHVVALGKFETGKTRLLNTLSRVAYRGLSPVSISSSALYRSVDSLNLSMFLSEYHDLDKDFRQEIDAVVKGGQKRGEPVLRSDMSDGNGVSGIDVFDTFSHCGVGTQFDVADDIKSRSIVVETKPADRDIPMHFDTRRGRKLRNRLLYARMRLLDSTEFFEAEQTAKEICEDRGITGRTREQLLGLLTVASLWDELDAMDRVIQQIAEQEEQVRQESEDAAIVQSILSAVWDTLVDDGTADVEPDWSNLKIPYRDVIDAYEQMTGQELTPSRLGHLVKRLGLDRSRYRDGTHIEDDDLRSKLQDLARTNNIEWTAPEDAKSNPDLALFDDDDSFQEDSDTGGMSVETVDQTAGGDTATVSTADARDELEGVIANTHQVLVEGGPLQRSKVYDLVDYPDDDVDDAIEHLLRKGELRDIGGGLVDVV